MVTVLLAAVGTLLKVTVTVAVLELSVPSLTLYVKVSVPVGVPVGV